MTERDRTAEQDQPRVVVVGDGFAGLFAGRRLARGPVQVTLLDRTGVHLFPGFRSWWADDHDGSGR